MLHKVDHLPCDIGNFFPSRHELTMMPGKFELLLKFNPESVLQTIGQKQLEFLFLRESTTEVLLKRNGDNTCFCSKELLDRCTNIARKANLSQMRKLSSPLCFLFVISLFCVQSRNKFFKKQVKVLVFLDTTGAICHHLMLLEMLLLSWLTLVCHSRRSWVCPRQPSVTLAALCGYLWGPRMSATALGTLLGTRIHTQRTLEIIQFSGFQT